MNDVFAVFAAAGHEKPAYFFLDVTHDDQNEAEVTGVIVDMPTANSVEVKDEDGAHHYFQHLVRAVGRRSGRLNPNTSQWQLRIERRRNPGVPASTPPTLFSKVILSRGV